MKRLSVILISFLLYLPLSAQFKGTVYIDADQSGIFNKGDKPLAGVMVTDGLNVVKTDKKGRFSLPGFEKTRFITITTPAGYETQHFYLPVKENRKSSLSAFVFSRILSIPPSPNTVSSFCSLKRVFSLNWASVKVGRKGRSSISKRNCK